MNYNTNVINPLAFSLLIIMSLMLFFGKRESMAIPLIFIACLITSMQRIVIFGIDFPYLRLLIIFGFLRFMLRKEQTVMKINTIDKVVISWTVIRIIVYSILWSSTSSIIYRIGETIDIVGVYFLIRLIIIDFKEYDVIVKTIILVSIPMSLFMIIEQVSGGRNFFSVLGGVPEFNILRGGKLRAQGAFSHPIMAGTFGATLFPLAWGIWQRKKKILALTGFITCFIITFACSSSGPIITLALCMFGVFFFRFRKYTKITRNLFFLSIIFLQLVMTAPVWHLISRIDVVGGSTGYHRYRLIDTAIEHIADWFFLGVQSTAYWGRGLFDVTNQYILEGVRGGMISLIFFIVIIVKCFQAVGVARMKFLNSLELQKYVWAFGTILFAHTITFISVSYFGQMVFFYSLLLAMISSLYNLPETRDTILV